MPSRLPQPIAILLLSGAVLAACGSRSKGEQDDQAKPPPADEPIVPVAEASSEAPAPASTPASSTPEPNATASSEDDAAPVDERLFGSWIPDSSELVWHEPGESALSTMSLTTYIGGDSFETTARCTFGDGTVLEARAESPAIVSASTIRIERTVEAIDTDESVETGVTHACTARVESGTVHYDLKGDFELELRFEGGIIASFVKQ